MDRATLKDWAVLTQRKPIARLRQRFRAVERKISVFLEKAFVVGEKFHRVVWFESIGFDRSVDLRLEKAHQFDFVPLRHGENFSDGAAFDHLLNVPTGFFIRIEENVHLSNASEQIMEVAHDVVMSGDDEKDDVRHLAG